MALRLDYGVDAPQSDLYDLDPMRAAATTALGGGGLSLPASSATASALAAPVGAADVYAVMERQMLRDLEQQAAAPKTKEAEGEQKIPWYGYILPGFAEGYAQGQVLKRQREELKLRQEHQKGQEAQAALQRLQLIEILRDRERQRQFGEQMSGLLGQGGDLQNPEVQRQMLAFAARQGNPETVLKLQELFQQTQGRQRLQAVEEGRPDPGMAPPSALPAAAPAPALLPTGGAPAPARQTISGALNPIQRLIVAKARELGLDPVQALAQAHQESGGTFDNSVTGKDGEIGIFQIMPGTGAELGYSPAQLRDPLTNITAGLTYLKQRGLARYNPGDPNYTRDVQRWMPRYQAVLGLEGGATPQTTPSLAANQQAQAAQAAATPPSAMAPSSQDAGRLRLLEAQRTDLEARLDRLNKVVPTIPGKAGDEGRKRQQELLNELRLKEEQIKNLRPELEPRFSQEFTDYVMGEAQQRPQDLFQTPQGRQQLQDLRRSYRLEKLQERLDVSAAQGREALEKDLDKTMSREDAEALGLPYGMTKRAAAALNVIPLTKTLQDQVNTAQGVRNLIDGLERQGEKLFAGITPENRVGAAFEKFAERFTQSNPDVVVYQAQTQAFLSLISRVYGERGVLTEQDTARVKPLIPQLFPVPDTEPVMRAKFKAMRDFINELEARGSKGAPTGTPGGKAAPVASTPAPAPATTKPLEQMSNEELFQALMGGMR